LSVGWRLPDEFNVCEEHDRSDFPQCAEKRAWRIDNGVFDSCRTAT
jgi:hypothetical protein